MVSERPNADVEPRIAPGTSIANYVVEDFVGQGTEGCVYVARDSLLGRQVALKTLRAGEAGETRGVEEARLLAGLEHPHIVRVYHARRHQGVWFVVCEYLSGGSLQAHLQRVGPLPLRRALELMAQAASGLAYAHAAGILHRDIKPQNMLLSKGGDVKLADFGLALDVRAPRRPSAQAVGTPAFLATELWSGASATPASDVFSLGACLFCLLTGRLPFVANDAEQLRRAHQELEPKLPSTIPVAVRELVLAMMAKEPSARPASHTLCETLRALAETPHRSPTARPQAPRPSPSDPFVAGGTERAVRETLRRGRDAAALAELAAALRARGTILLSAPSNADALLFSELAREQGDERYALLARLTLPKAQSSLGELLRRRLDLPADIEFASACERLLVSARDVAGQPLVELCLPRTPAAEQRAELAGFVALADARGVVCVLIGASDDAPALPGCRRIELLSVNDGLCEFEARLALWLELATAGRFAFSRDGLRLAAAVCREEGRFWPRLAQDCLLITAAAGLPFITTWAVLNARTLPHPCHGIDDVPAVARRRPLSWPPPKLALLLARLRESGEGSLLRERSTLLPPASLPPKDFEPTLPLQNLASNT